MAVTAVSSNADLVVREHYRPEIKHDVLLGSIFIGSMSDEQAQVINSDHRDDGNPE